MGIRPIFLVFVLMLFISVTAALVLVLYARSDAGASALERLERNPDWRGSTTYASPAR